jgi:crotonobetainyl-CoA:carnitine CoA-transferase CaiB-like acyl-CoA transferase
MASDPRFASNAKRVENRGALVEAMFAHLKERPAAEWLAILRREDVPADPIQDISEVFADPQVLAREMLVTIPHPTLGEVRSAGSALKLSETPVHYTRHPPLLGEHTEEILASLGHTQGQISALRKEGVV